MTRLKRLTTANSVIAILLLLIFAFLSFERFHAMALEESSERLEKSMLTFHELLSHKGVGFTVADGKLMAGNYVINGNFEVPDKVQEIFGGTATVFMGDTRVSTNVDPQRLTRAAHALKGAVANFGARDLFEAALKLEMTGKRGELTGAPESISALEGELERLQRSLTAFIGGRNVQILIAEDDAVSRRIIEVHLAKWGYQVVTARDGNEAWQILQSVGAPRIAILDWMMPGLDGVEVCRRVRRESEEPYTYLILLTTLNGAEDIVAGMSAGADDYLTKPYHASELRVRLRAGRRIVDLQEELIAAREALRAKASHDPLTGLWNHEEILAILGRELARGERDGHPVAVIMADLDHFKLVNDTYGHMAGDAVLRETARRMMPLMRPYDAAGRYGGEEFLFVLPSCHRGNVAVMAHRIRLLIGNDPMNTMEGMIPVTVSLGAAVSRPGEADAASLVRAADLALYRAKAMGRNRVEVGRVEVFETHVNTPGNAEIEEPAVFAEGKPSIS